MTPLLGTASRRFLVVTLLLVGTLALSELFGARKPLPLSAPLSSVPLEIGGWKGQDAPPLSKVFTDSLRATSYLTRTYRFGTESMNLFVAYYGNQRQGESMHSPRHCLPGTGWEVIEHGMLDVPAGHTSVAINKYLVQREKERLAVLYWYQSRRRVVASEYAGKFWLAWDGLRTGLTDGAIVRITVRPERLDEGVHFAASVIGSLQTCFGR